MHGALNALVAAGEPGSTSTISMPLTPGAKRSTTPAGFAPAFASVASASAGGLNLVYGSFRLCKRSATMAGAAAASSAFCAAVCALLTAADQRGDVSSDSS